MATLTGLQGANLAAAAYSGSTTIEGYTLISLVSNPFINFDTGIFTGFQVALYKNPQGKYVIAFAGTDSILDGIADVSMGIHTLLAGVTSQFIQGDAVVTQWKTQYGLSTSNTSIVGHSLGGALAQYFGANTGFETLTYNAYGIGYEVSGGSNITNYVTMYDPVCILPRSKMIGKTYMLQDETLTAMLGHGISNFTSESSWVRGYSRVNSPHDIDVIYDGYVEEDERRIYAKINGSKDDVILGGEINNVLIGGGGKDALYGMGGSDTLQGGAGNDTLIGGYSDKDDGVADSFLGGTGFDTYITGNGDTIKDSDGKGLVKFEGIDLTGKKYKNKDTGRYEDDDYIYNGDPKSTKGTLTITAKKGSKSITIQEWSNKDLGIELAGKDIDVSITKSAQDNEGNSGKRSLYFTVTLSRALEDGEGLKVSVSNTDEGSYTFTSGEKSHIFTHSWQGDTKIEGWIDHIAILTPTASYSGPTKDVKVKVLNSGTATVYDDDQSHDPLALDMDMDGFISTTALETSGTYFDITGDGLKERVGWIRGEDALLVYDKNDNAQIDGIDEVFGNANESGFEELKRTIDSNHDNKIDRRDELFAQLQVWNDLNQDAEVQEGELKSLSDAKITSIDLNYVSTNIEINGNLLAEASKYTTTTGSKELAADIQLATDAKDTRVDIDDIPDFTIDPITHLLPQLRGSGLVYDSFIRYNMDPEFKVIAVAMSEDMATVATRFDTFIEHYSGYTAYVNQLREKYSQDTFDMVEADKRAWIVERFEATNTNTVGIEAYYNTNLNGGKIPTVAKTSDATMEIKYQSLAGKIESTFAMQSVFGDVFSDTHYDLSTQSFIIDDTVAMNAKITGYFNSDTKTIEEKLYLAKVMQMQQGGLVYDINTIVQSIDNDIVQSLVSDIYTGTALSAFETKESYTTEGIIVATDANELITLSDVDTKILLRKGNDQLNSGKGNNILYYRRGDGSDTIADRGGFDSLIFDESITRESVEIRLNRNSDLVIALKEEGKSFDELTDKITIVDWMKPSNRVEAIVFGDGSTMKFQDVFDLFAATDGVEVIGLSSGNDIIDVKGGNDIIQALGGNDTLIGGRGDDRLEGGLGNDTYIYSRGDGKDTIIDSGDHDTLQFGEGVTIDDLMVKFVGNDLLIALKKEGIVFDQLSDVITLKNYKSPENNIEAIYLDGYQIVDIDELLNAPTEFDDTLILSNDDHTIDLLSGNDTLSTGTGNDIVSGNGGDDTIKSYGGNDTLSGNEGNDTLEGGLGDDTYLFNRGDGKDTIYDDYSYGYQNTQKDNAGNDTLRFGDGIIASDISFSRGGPEASNGGFEWYGPGIDDLIVTISNGGGQIIIREYFNQYNTIENFLLSDGTALKVSNFETPVVPVVPVITSAGNDTYTFSRSDVPLTIIDQGGSDTLSFGEGITQEDIIGKQIGNDFIIALKEDGKTFNKLTQKVIIQNYNNIANQVETILFTDGTSIATESLKVATDGDDILVFSNENKTIDALAGNDTLSTGSGDDTLIGGIGDDTLNGGNGNDTYVFHRGYGKDIINDSSGNDTLRFGEGIGTDVLEARFVSQNIVIGLKENGVPFESWSDTITINSNNVENIVLNDGTKVSLGSILTRPTSNDDSLNFGNLHEAITIDTLGGNDTVSTGTGNDTLKGGAGNDTLNGGAGDDTYLFNRWDGRDTITSSYGKDTLIFGAGIGANEIEARFIGNDLVVAIKESGVAFEALSDKITIHNNFISTIMLNDGTKLSLDDMYSRPTQGDDVLDYSYTQNAITVDGLGGNDTIITNNGNDTIAGGSGNDLLNSGFGSDTLKGGVGNDTLQGGAGNDTYVFNRGDGNDTLNDNYYSWSNFSDNAGNDTLILGAGIIKSDLLFKQEGYNLTIALREEGKTFDESSDKILISDWFRINNNIETIRFSDGTTMSASEIAGMVLSTQSDTLYSNHGAEMFGGLGDDTYVYKKDDFTVIINEQFANKEISVNAGNGNDTLKFDDINRNQVTIGVKGNDLILKIDAAHETYTELKDYVVIRDWKNPNRGIEQIVFGDGEVLIIDKTATYPALEFNENWITSRYYIYGSENNDIQGSEFSEVIESGAGNDTVMALGGNDYLTGGIGNDTLNGGDGNDTYVFSIGDGKDTITDTSGLDTIKFGSGITRSDISITKVNNDLVITLSANDQLTLKEWFNEATIENRVEVMVLDNEGEISIADFIIAPTEGNDNLEYGDEKNRINALGGDDIIHIGGGNDTLMGNGGSDRLYGEEGDDLIGGDQGNDVLYGGDGNDTYLFARGDGNDMIIEDNFANWGQSGNDTLKFKEGISAADLILVQSRDDLIVALKEEGKTFDQLSDKITLKNWSLYDEANSRDLSRGYYAIENFSFSDGTTWGMSDIIAHIGSDADESVIGFNQADTLIGQKGNDTLLGHLGNDTYVFNRGDGQDVIYDYGRKGENYSYYDAGNDTLKFGSGIGEADLIFGKDNNDVIIYIKDFNGAISDTSDKIVLKDWFIANNRIENMVLSDGTPIDYIKYLSVEPTSGDDKLIYGNSDHYVDALEGDDIVVALGGNNIIDGNSGNDNIKTEDGTDILIGREGNDTLDAGAGDDTLEGGSGDDIYIFNRGDGADSISDTLGLDTLSFGAEVTSDDLVLFQDGNNLIIALKEDGVEIAELSDKVTIINWLDASTRLESIAFNDGTALDVSNVISMTGTDGDDIIRGIELDDAIYAGAGNDTLSGDTGNDYLEGGEGNDTYLFNRGDGHDTIYDAIGNDQLKFGKGVGADDLWVKQDGNDLIVALKETDVDFENLSNKVILTNWVDAENRVETLAFDNGAVLTTNNIIEMLPSEDADEIYLPNEIAVNIHLKEGDDYIEAGSQNDTIYGDGGDDAIYAGAGNDTLSGDTGNDYLEGDAGDDRYLFNRGDGHDTISDAGGVDKLSLGEGIGANDLWIKQDENDLIIALKEDGIAFADLTDKIIINDWAISETKVETFVFNDGVIFGTKEIIEHIPSKEADEIYVPTELVVNIALDEGDDYIKAGSQNDTIYGDAGDDAIYAGAGNDTLSGGTGNDYLEGGEGNDTYIFNRGDGQDRIYDMDDSYSDRNSVRTMALMAVADNGDSAKDTLRFGEGITKDDLIAISVAGEGDDLIIALKEDGVDFESLHDKIIIRDWANHTIEQIQLADGSVLSTNDIIALQSTDQDDTIAGTNYDDTLNGGNGNDTLEGGIGDDTYIFNRGDGHDTIFDTFGNYTLVFGESITINDLFVEVDGNNILIGLKEDGKDFSMLSDVITIENMLMSENQIDNFSFADGTSYTVQEAYELLYGNNQNNDYYGDSYYGDEGNDTFYGGKGNDLMFGEYGDDTLIGNQGDDGLYGGYGNDTYIFNRGDGHDMIDDQGSYYDYYGDYYGGNGNIQDVIQFGEGITIDDIVVELAEGNLLIGIKPNSEYGDIHSFDDYITVQGGAYENHTIETIRLSNGETYNITPRTYISTPIVLDLNHNSITSTAIEISNAYFDYDGDGNRERTGWAENEDVMLVTDLNNDGIINDGSEHFGNFTRLSDGTLAKNGYEALAQYDSNSDGVIDNRDEAFGNLLLWKDANQNGKTEEGELTNIQTSGILALHLNTTNGITFEQTTENGNIVLNETNYVTLGNSGIMRDVGFAYDPFDTITNNDTLSKEFYGNTLIGGEGNDTYLFSFGDGKITIDDQGEGADLIKFGTDISQEQLIVKWISGSDDLLIGIRDDIDDNRPLSSLENQILIKNFFNNSGSIETIEFNDLTTLSKSELYDILLDTRATKNLTARVLENDGPLIGGNGNDVLYGANGQEMIDGGVGNDYLKGLDDDDYLIGGEGSDTLQGGIGDDTLDGGNGNDVYLYNKGDGRDVITDFGGVDSIMFGEDISSQDIVLSLYENDLLITFGYDSDIPAQNRDSIHIMNFDLQGFAIESFEFANGESILIASLLNQVPEAPTETSHTLQDIRVLSGNVEATDIDGDELSYTVSTEASHGTLSVNETGEWSYSAADGYMGTDSAIVTIDDGEGGVVTQSLNFDVRVSTPTLSDSTSNLLEDTNATGTLNVVNPIGGTLIYEVLTASTKGTFSINEAAEWNYTPHADLNGSDTVTIKVTNAYGLSTTATLNLAIEAVNDAPILTETPSAVTLYAGATSTGSIKASDVDGDTLSYSVTSTPEHGTLSINEKGEWNYSAERYYAGESNATITIDDGHGGSVASTLSFTNLMTPDWHYTYMGDTMNITDSDGIDLLMMNTVSMSDLSFIQEGKNLRIDVKDKNDVILTDYFTSTQKGVETVQTSEGTINLSKEKIGVSGRFFGVTWGSSKADLFSGNSNTDLFCADAGNDTLFGNNGNDCLSGNNGNDLILGGEGDDSLYGGNNEDILYGDNGNDTLYGDAGHDKLFGGKGNDTLYGGDGNDTLHAGEGTNTLNGSSGDDLYLLSKGANNTLINEGMIGFNLFGRWIGQNGGNDTIKFDKGVKKEEISFFTKGNDLLVQYGNSEFITINNQKNEANKIEKLQLDDGSYLSNTDIDRIVQQINAYSKDHGFHIANNAQIQNNQALMNIVASGWHQ